MDLEKEAPLPSECQGVQLDWFRGRCEINSMGLATVLIVENDSRAVILTCFGENLQMDEIAATLGIFK